VAVAVVMAVVVAMAAVEVMAAEVAMGVGDTVAEEDAGVAA